jgi:SAM-dependent methyltransferase
LYAGKNAGEYYKSRGGTAAAIQLPLLPTSQAEWIQQSAPDAWTGKAQPIFVDVGCGAGFLLSRLWGLSPRNDIRMIGYEPSKEVAETAMLTLKTYAAGSRYIVHPTLFDGCGEQAGKVTLITMSHVIEHIATPHSTLITLAKCLMPGGYAFLAVPNKPLSGEASFTIEHEVNTKGTRGVGFQGDFRPKHNFHLFYFTERSLRVLIHSGHNSTFSIVDSFSNSKEVRMLLRRRI